MNPVLPILQLDFIILFVNEKKRRAVLQEQLAFSRNIFNVTCSASLFNKTEPVGNRPFDISLQELFDNFVEVLKSLRGPQNQVRVEAKIVKLDERKIIVEHQNNNLMDKISIARMGRLNKLKRFIGNPELLEGISIQHRFRENKDLEATWYQANVVGIDRINRSNLKLTLFDIVYDGERDDVFSFPLILGMGMSCQSESKYSILICF